MKHLILLRHAKAEKRAASGDDFDRPLSRQGQADAALMGRVLAEAGYAPDAGVVSAALRTRETWEQAAAAFPGSAVAYSRRLYNAEPSTLLELAETELRRADCVMVVAHNPGVQELTVALLNQAGAAPAEVARALQSFPTGTAAAFTIAGDGALSATRLFYPADHGGRGGD